MVGAPEILAVAELALAHGGAPMPAAIDHRGDLAVRLARHNDGMPSQLRGLVVARFGNLRFVGKIYPGRIEYPGHLQVEDAGVRVHRPMDGARAYELIDGWSHGSGSRKELKKAIEIA